MREELPFRIALVVVFAFTMAVTVYHRRRAATSGEKVSRRSEGYLFAITLRSVALALMLSTIAYLAYPPAVAWAAMPIPVAVRVIGVATGLACSWLMYQTLAILGKNLTDTVETRASATLVTDGPYRWVRHPFYVTTALVMASATLISASALIGLLSVVVLALLAIRTPKEERKLAERFGEPYLDYARRTNRFLPRWPRPR
jgi:protein-S-isoprenylcysteine O-methyltransferase Ste14